MPAPLYAQRKYLGSYRPQTGSTKVNFPGQGAILVKDQGAARTLFGRLSQQIRAKLEYVERDSGITEVFTQQSVPFDPSVVFGDNLVYVAQPSLDTVNAAVGNTFSKWAASVANANTPVLPSWVQDTANKQMTLQSDNFVYVAGDATRGVSMNTPLSPYFSIFGVAFFLAVNAAGNIFCASGVSQSAPVEPDIQLQMTVGGEVQLLAGPEQTNIGVPSAVLANHTYYIEIHRSPTTIELWLNGVLVGSSIAVADFAQQGNFAQQNLGRLGVLDGVAMYIGSWALVNRVATAAEREGYYNQLVYQYPPTISLRVAEKLARRAAAPRRRRVGVGDVDAPADGRLHVHRVPVTRRRRWQEGARRDAVAELVIDGRGAQAPGEIHVPEFGEQIVLDPARRVATPVPDPRSHGARQLDGQGVRGTCAKRPGKIHGLSRVASDRLIAGLRDEGDEQAVDLALLARLGEERHEQGAKHFHAEAPLVRGGGRAPLHLQGEIAQVFAHSLEPAKPRENKQALARKSLAGRQKERGPMSVGPLHPSRSDRVQPMATLAKGPRNVKKPA